MSREDRNEMLQARMREAAEYIEDMPRFLPRTRRRSPRPICGCWENPTGI